MSESGVYVVRPGDTVRSVAGALGVPAMELCRVNGLRPGDQLKPGQKLKLPRLQKVEQTQNLWTSADKTPAQGFEPLRHIQTQMIQLPRFAKKPEVKPEPAAQPTTPSWMPTTRPRQRASRREWPRKNVCWKKSPTAGPRAPTDKDGRLSHEAALQAKRLADRRNEQEESGLINPFGGMGAGTKTVALQIPKFDQIPPPDAPAARTPAAESPPRLRLRPRRPGRRPRPRTQTTRMAPDARTERKARAFLPDAGRKGRAPETPRRTNERCSSNSKTLGASRRGSSPFPMSRPRWIVATRSSISMKVARRKEARINSKSLLEPRRRVPRAERLLQDGGTWRVRCGGDRFSTGKKDAGDSDGDVFKKYRNAGAEPAKDAGADLAWANQTVTARLCARTRFESETSELPCRPR
jgi:LysM repeat protein